MSVKFKDGTFPEMAVNDLSDPVFEKDFFQALSEVANSPERKAVLVNMVLMNAQKGDPASLKILERAMNEGRFSEDRKIKITNEQFRQIIKLAAERLG